MGRVVGPAPEQDPGPRARLVDRCPNGPVRHRLVGHLPDTALVAWNPQTEPGSNHLGQGSVCGGGQGSVRGGQLLHGRQGRPLHGPGNRGERPEGDRPRRARSGRTPLARHRPPHPRALVETHRCASSGAARVPAQGSPDASRRGRRRRPDPVPCRGPSPLRCRFCRPAQTDAPGLARRSPRPRAAT